MAGDALIERLQALGLLRADFEVPAPAPATERTEEDEDEDDDWPRRRRRKSAPPPHLRLLTLCDARALDGGLSVALDVRPDELMGPLCMTIGGGARKVRVLDVREGPPMEVRISHGATEEPWELEDLYALVHNLNDLLRDDPTARVVAVLGEWQDSLQLWCLPKAKLPLLFAESFFAPRNRHQLERIVEGLDAP